MTGVHIWNRSVIPQSDFVDTGASRYSSSTVVLDGCASDLLVVVVYFGTAIYLFVHSVSDHIINITWREITISTIKITENRRRDENVSLCLATSWK